MEGFCVTLRITRDRLGFARLVDFQLSGGKKITFSILDNGALVSVSLNTVDPCRCDGISLFKIG